MIASIAILDDLHASTGAKMTALRDLQKRTDRKSTDAIARALLTAPQDLRAPLLRALQKRGGAATYQQALGGDEPVFAAKVLRALGDQSSSTALAQVLVQSDNDSLRSAAAHALAMIGCREPESLFVALADAQSQVRFFIVIALGLAPKSPKIAHALSAHDAVETDPVVRSEIARVLRSY